MLSWKSLIILNKINSDSQGQNFSSLAKPNEVWIFENIFKFTYEHLNRALIFNPFSIRFYRNFVNLYSFKKTTPFFYKNSFGIGGGGISSFHHGYALTYVQN